MRRRGLVAALVACGVAASAPGALAAGPHLGKDGCDHSKPPSGSHTARWAKPGQVLARGAKAKIVMVTSCGTVTIQLALDKKNPIPNSIAFLVTKHFYDGLSLFRDVKAFVIQGGDPNNNGSAGPGYQVVGPVPAGYSYQIGDIAMAKTDTDGAGAAGSQFFIITGELGKELPTEYGLLGHAADKASLATIARLASFAGPGDRPPTKALYIWSAKLVKE